MVISGNIYVVNTGDTFEYPINLTNLGANTSTNTIVTINLSSGISITAGTPTVGTFNVGTGVWSIGNLIPNTEVSILLDVLVDEINDNPFTIEAVASSNQIESIVINNTKESTIYQLCSAFSECFINGSTFYIDLPVDQSESGLEAARDAEVTDPQCGDQIFIGSGCSDVWHSAYTCVDDSWSTPVLLKKGLLEEGILYVSPAGDDDLGEEGYSECAYLTIEAAITAATDGSIIKIKSGLYELTDFLDLSGKSNLTFILEEGAIIKAAEDSLIFSDPDLDYLGVLKIVGGKLVGDSTDTVIYMGSTDATNKLIVKDIEIINLQGGAISFEKAAFLDNVKMYDVSELGNCIETSIPDNPVQSINTYANTVTDDNVLVSVSPVVVDPTLVIDYV